MSPSVDVDGIDHQILDLLQSDARRTLADIGSHVSLSASAVKRRIDRLEASGVIAGYRAVVDQSKLGQQLEAFAELTFAGDTKVADIASSAEGLPGVQAVFTTAGDPDALVWIRVRDMADLTRVIDLLRRSGRVTSHEDAHGARHVDRRLDVELTRLGSVDLGALRHRGPELVEREVRRRRDVEDHRFAPHQQVARRGQLVGDLVRDDDRAVGVGVDEVARVGRPCRRR